MYYLIDGYNLLFFFQEDERCSLESQRKRLLEWIQDAFSNMKCQGTVVFDGAHPRGTESGRAYQSPLEIAYAPKGISADAYILEQLEAAKNRKTFVVVTNDRALRSHAVSLEAKTQSNEAFVAWLKKRNGAKKNRKRRAAVETPAQIARLAKMFEERLDKIDKNDLL